MVLIAVQARASSGVSERLTGVVEAVAEAAVTVRARPFPSNSWSRTVQWEENELKNNWGVFRA